MQTTRSPQMQIADSRMISFSRTILMLDGYAGEFSQDIAARVYRQDHAGTANRNALIDVENRSTILLKEYLGIFVD